MDVEKQRRYCWRRCAARAVTFVQNLKLLLRKLEKTSGGGTDIRPTTVSGLTRDRNVRKHNPKGLLALLCTNDCSLSIHPRSLDSESQEKVAFTEFVLMMACHPFAMPYTRNE